MKKKILVIAYKYNDILYASETFEFKNSDEKYLLVFTRNSSVDKFPLIGIFDNVYNINFTSRAKILNTLKVLNFLLKYKKVLKLNYLTLSQPYMLFNQLIFKYLKPQKLLLIEDGLMNYESYTYSIPILKSYIHKLLKIDNSFLLQKISKTYLLKPELSTFKFGQIEKLKISGNNFSLTNALQNKLKEKKFLIGINIYPEYCTEKEYYEMIVKSMTFFNIDYYIPHTLESYSNQLDKSLIFDLNELGFTFEYLATKINFTIYSFGSSLLFSTKVINPKVNSNLIKISYFDIQSITKVLSICDNTYEYELIKDDNES